MRKQTYQQQLYADAGLDVSAQTILVTTLLGFTLVYLLVQGVVGLPPLWDLILIYLPGKMFGPAVQERLQMAFGTSRMGIGGPGKIMGRVRARAGSILGVSSEPKEGLVGGLWNTGNTCYQNSVLQAMASLDHLQPHLRALGDETRVDEGPFPSFILADLIRSLNTLSQSPRAISAPYIVRVGDASSWRYNDQQDAQEFFQKLTAALEKEVASYWKEVKTHPGLEAIKAGEKELKFKEDDYKGRLLPEELRNPFEGFLAQRVGCLQCGYVEAIRLQAFTSLSLPLPSTVACSIEDCLTEFTHIEPIDEVDCDKCSLLLQYQRLQKLLNPPEEAQPTPAALREAVEQRLKDVITALEEDDFSEATFKKLKIAQKVSSTKTKHIMIARPPPVLALHMNRSRFNPITGMSVKNYAAVTFPKFLDLGPWTTKHDSLEVNPAKPISPIPEPSLEQLESVTSDGTERVLYELKSVVAHYGGHHNGHYVNYRKSGGTWYKISDEEVYTCDEEDVLLASNAFMVFYEQMDAPPPSSKVATQAESIEEEDSQSGLSRADSKPPATERETPSSAATEISPSDFAASAGRSTPLSSIASSEASSPTFGSKSHLPTPPPTDDDDELHTAWDSSTSESVQGQQTPSSSENEGVNTPTSIGTPARRLTPSPTPE